MPPGRTPSPGAGPARVVLRAVAALAIAQSLWVLSPLGSGGARAGQPVADLAVGLSLSPDAFLNESLVVGVPFANLGPDAAAGVLVRAIIPTRLLFTNVTIVPPDTGDCFASSPGSAGRFVGCTLPTLPADASGTVVITTVPQQTGTATIDAGISAPAIEDPNSANDMATGTTSIGDATTIPPVVTKRDVLADDAGGDGFPSAGDRIEYVVAIDALDERSGTNVILLDTPGAGTTLVPGTVTVVRLGGAGTVVQGNGSGDTMVEVALGAVAGEALEVRYQVRVDDPLSADVDRVENQAVLVGDGFNAVSDDPDTTAVGDPTAVAVGRRGLRAFKTVHRFEGTFANGIFTPDPTTGRTSVQWRIALVNTGDEPVTGVQIRDVLQGTGTTLRGQDQFAVTTTQGTVTKATDAETTVDVGTVAPGATIVIQLLADVVAETIANQAEVTGDGFALPTDDPFTETPDDPTTVRDGALNDGDVTLRAVKRDRLLVDADGDGVPSPGDTLRYEIRLVAVGRGFTIFYVRNLQLLDIPSGGLQIVGGSGSATRGTVSDATPGELAWSVADMLPGEVIVVVFDAVIEPGLSESVTRVANQAHVAFDVADDQEVADEAASDDPETPDFGDETVTHLRGVVPTATPTASATPTSTRTATPTSSATRTATATPTRTVTPTASASSTPTATATATPTPTPTRTPTPAPTITATRTATATPPLPTPAAGTCHGFPVTIFGTAGPDRLRGTAGPDVIRGFGGDDVLIGAGGDDVLCGDEGADRLLGGDGNDVLFGDADDDRLDGGAGRDQLFGDVGDDVLRGGSEADDLHGGPGDDRLEGGAGDDLLFGEAGRDRLDGEDGGDTLEGGSERDRLAGGPGDDLMSGGDHDDLLRGGDGFDVMRGDDGDDHLDGGDGPSVLIGGPGDDRLRGGPKVDRMRGEDGRDVMQGGDGDDEMLGGAGPDNIDGGAGRDFILGGDGADIVFGGADDDSVHGDGGKDIVGGGGGDDLLFGDDDDDTLVGGPGDDTLDGGLGNDDLDGSGGDDTLVGAEGDDTLAGGPGDDFLDGDRDIVAVPGNDSCDGEGGFDRALNCERRTSIP